VNIVSYYCLFNEIYFASSYDFLFVVDDYFFTEAVNVAVILSLILLVLFSPQDSNCASSAVDSLDASSYYVPTALRRSWKCMDYQFVLTPLILSTCLSIPFYQIVEDYSSTQWFLVLDIIMWSQIVLSLLYPFIFVCKRASDSSFVEDDDENGTRERQKSFSLYGPLRSLSSDILPNLHPITFPVYVVLKLIFFMVWDSSFFLSVSNGGIYTIMQQGYEPILIMLIYMSLCSVVISWYRIVTEWVCRWKLSKLDLQASQRHRIRRYGSNETMNGQDDDSIEASSRSTTCDSRVLLLVDKQGVILT
jgi:hypothetical protein